MKKNIQKKNIPHAYFLTFRTYATWLHGDARTSVDPNHNIYATPRIPANPALNKVMQSECLEDIFILNASYRNTVLESLIETCNYNHWYLNAAHVRTNHVHIILRAEMEEETIRKKIKIYATKALKNKHPELSTRHKFWAEGGSGKHIWAPEFLFPVMHYVIEEQGEKMAVYYEKGYEANFQDCLKFC